MVLRISKGSCENCGEREVDVGIGRRTCTKCDVTGYVCADCARAGECKSCNNGKLMQTEALFPHSLFKAIRSGDLHGLRKVLSEYQEKIAWVRDEAGRPPLSVAAELEDKSAAHQIFRLLLDHGADPRARDNGGETPLMLMRSMNSYRADTADLLRASVNDTDNQGRTALMYAAHGTGSMGQRKGNLRMAQHLIEMGTDPTATDTYGKTALGWANSFNDTGKNEEMIAYLKEQVMSFVAKRLFHLNYRASFDDKGTLHYELKKQHDSR